MSDTEMSAQAPEPADANSRITLSTKDLSPEDKKMVRGIFLHSFNVFAMK